jgi:hypothetical protein
MLLLNRLLKYRVATLAGSLSLTRSPPALTLVAATDPSITRHGAENYKPMGDR